MKYATLLRTVILSLMIGVSAYADASAQVARRSPNEPTVKGGTTTQPNAPVPIYKPTPTSPVPAPSTRPAPVPQDRRSEDRTTQQQQEIDRNYDLNHDGVISTSERKQMKAIMKADKKANKKRAKELRKANRNADHESWSEDRRRRVAEERLQHRSKELKLRHDDDNDD